MIPGKRYRIRFTYHPGNGKPTEREMVAVYLGDNKPLDEHEFSGRPLFGTCGVRRKDFIRSTQTTDPIHAPRPVRL